MKTWQEVVKKRKLKREKDMKELKEKARIASQWDDGLLQALVGALPRCKPEKLASVLADMIKKEPADAPATEAAYDSCYVLYENANGITPDQFWSDGFQILWSECLHHCAQQRTKWKFFPVVVITPFAKRMNIMVSATGKNIALSDLAQLEFIAKKIRDSQSGLYKELERTIVDDDTSVIDALRDLYPDEMVPPPPAEAVDSEPSSLSSDSDGFHLKYDRFANIYGAPETRTSDSSTDTDGETLKRLSKECNNEKCAVNKRTSAKCANEEIKRKHEKVMESMKKGKDGEALTEDELRFLPVEEIERRQNLLVQSPDEEPSTDSNHSTKTLREMNILEKPVTDTSAPPVTPTASPVPDPDFTSSFSESLLDSMALPRGPVMTSTQQPRTRTGEGKFATTPPATKPAGRYSEAPPPEQLTPNLRRKREDKIKTAVIASRRESLLTPNDFSTSINSGAPSSVSSTPEQPTKVTKLSSSPVPPQTFEKLLQDFDVIQRQFRQMEVKNEELTRANEAQNRQIAQLLNAPSNLPYHASRNEPIQYPTRDRSSLATSTHSLPNLPLSPIKPPSVPVGWTLNQHGQPVFDTRHRTREVMEREALAGRVTSPWPERNLPPRGQYPGRQYARGRSTRSHTSRNMPPT